jgi:hypothetical protein
MRVIIFVYGEYKLDLTSKLGYSNQQLIAAKSADQSEEEVTFIPGLALVNSPDL